MYAEEKSAHGHAFIKSKGGCVMQFYSEPQGSSAYDSGARIDVFHEKWARDSDSYALPLKGMLGPLLQRLRHYDNLRIKLERSGGDAA